MGTHPIFESDFDCLTDCGIVLMPGVVKQEETVMTELEVSPKIKKVKKSKKQKLEPKIEAEEDSGVQDVAPTPEKKKKTKKRKSEDSTTPKKKKSKKVKEEVPELEPEESTADSEDKQVESSEEEAPALPFQEEWNKLSETTRQKLKDRGVIQLFLVQAKTYQNILDGNDVIVQSRTGSGKTLAFAIPTVEKLMEEKNTKRGRYPRALILAPTRELASQICRDVESISTGLTAVAVYGGVPYERQESVLARGSDVIVGTPGRVKDLLTKGTLNFSELKIVALDEVDRMLDMGFADAVDECIGQCYENSQPQTLFFSATCPTWVKDTAKKYMKKVPPVINLIGKDENRTSRTVRHLGIMCKYHDWADVIGDLVTCFCGKQGRAIIFASTKKDTSDLALSDTISDAQMIHGDIEQKTREQTLKAFRDGKMRILVATDVAARGLDIPEVDLVIQTNPPSDVDSYIHRSGRTGRAGRKGISICLYKPQEQYQMQKVEHIAGFNFEYRGPVTATELEEAAAKDVKEQIAKLPEKSGTRFLEVAREMIASAEEEGSSAENLLASAIAIMSGVTDCSVRSILNNKKGSQTWQMDVKFEIRSTGFIYGMLEKGISAEVRGAAKAMRSFKNKLGGVFDLPAEMTEQVEANWNDTATITLQKCETLPELAPLKFDNSVPRSGFGGGGRGRGGGGRGGGRGRGGGFSGQKRSFGGGGDRQPWKRKKY